MPDTNTQRDTITTFHGALIQHGPLSRRIYLMKLGDADPVVIIPAMDELARLNGYTKLFAKVPKDRTGHFTSAGYEREAAIPGLYRGAMDAVFLSRFLDPARRIELRADEIAGILDIACEKQKHPVPLSALPAATCIRRCTPGDADAMSELYRTVFPTYPFPIDDPGYIRETMRDHIVYYAIETGGRLLALSSAETDRASANVEMTDFATLPGFRGNGFAHRLLAQMARDMRTEGMRTAYTIARAISPGMNVTFARQGYTYGGRLVNNTNIAGSIESMNVWYRPLD